MLGKKKNESKIQLPIDVVQSTIERLSLSELAGWAGTSRENRALVGKELRLRLGRLLGPFSCDVDGFLRMLDDHRSLVSGSLALAFASGDNHWMPNDLDIYVPHDMFVPVVEYMQRVEGYELMWEKTKDSIIAQIAQELMYSDALTTSSLQQHVYGLSPAETGIAAVATMRKGLVKVDIIQAKSFGAGHPVSMFWSTLQMNIITGKGALISYPDLTSNRIGLLNPVVLDSFGLPRAYVLPLLEKYTQRGYSFHTRADSLPFINDPSLPYGVAASAMRDNDCGHEMAYCPSTQRGFEDRHSMRFAFKGDGVEFDTGSAVMTHEWMASWKLGGFEGGQKVKGSAYAFNRLTGELNWPREFSNGVQVVGVDRDFEVVRRLKWHLLKDPYV